jgi:hypothetical protein
MKKIILFISSFFILIGTIIGQSNRGIHLQGIARNDNGIIVANKQIALRVSIVKDSALGNIAYQEIMSVTTNVLGLFFVDIGTAEKNKIITIGDFEKIDWGLMNYYIQLEILGLLKMSEVVITKIENDSSIEITKNTKGYTWSIKAYGGSEIEIANKLKNLKATATSIVKELETVL